MANNITKVYLLDVPLEDDYKNTLYFASASAQQTYFQGRIKHSYTDFSYQRKDNFIRIPAHYDALQDCNYVMYMNTQYSNKWYYAFITEMKYIDDGRTDIYIDTDVMQTWMFDITIKPSFIDREHTNNDAVGSNLLPEGLDLGDYISYKEERIDLSDMAYVLVLDPSNDGNSFVKTSNIINGYSMMIFYPHSSLGDNTAEGNLASTLGEWSTDKKASIFDVFSVPWDVIKSDVSWDANNQCYRINNSLGTSLHPKYVDVNNNSYYTARNNKLYTYPYVYLEGSNLKGQTIKYKYEYFDQKSSATFILTGNCIGSGDAILYPLDYAGDSTNYNAGMSHSGYVHSGWGIDGYSLFVAQNSNRMITDIANTVIGGGARVLGGGSSVSAGIDSATSITNAMATTEDAKHNLDINKGAITSGTLPLSMHINGFRFRKMGINSYYAGIIDSYFDMFGYKTNKVKTPNTNHRANYWYTKTIDINIDGAVPNKDMQKIKDCYNSGITFWKNPSNIQNYSVANGIV